MLRALWVLGAVEALGELVWGNPTQEFQRTPEDRELTVNFAFRNDGKTPVTISKVTSSCGCTTAELPKKIYQPGEAGTLPVKFSRPPNTLPPVRRVK